MELLHAGYVVTRPFAPKKWMGVTAERVVSVSTCIADLMPNYWCIEWWRGAELESVVRARQMGLADHRVAEAVALASSAMERPADRYPGSIAELDAAQRLCALCSDAIVVSVAVRADALADWLADPDPLDGSFRTVLALNRPAPEIREVVGWEVVGDEFSRHSWLCHGLPQILADAGERLELTKYGLLARSDDAVSIAARCDREELAAEPLPWFAVRLGRV